MIWRGKRYTPAADIGTLLELEDEVGSLPAFLRRLEDGRWTLAELLTAVHAFLHAAGCECDYGELGREVVARGAGSYRRAVGAYLCGVLGERKEGFDDAAV